MQKAPPSSTPRPGSAASGSACGANAAASGCGCWRRSRPAGPRNGRRTGSRPAGRGRSAGRGPRGSDPHRLRPACAADGGDRLRRAHPQRRGHAEADRDHRPLRRYRRRRLAAGSVGRGSGDRRHLGRHQPRPAHGRGRHCPTRGAGGGGGGSDVQRPWPARARKGAAGDRGRERALERDRQPAAERGPPCRAGRGGGNNVRQAGPRTGAGDRR